MLKFNDDIKEANLKETKGNKLKVVLTTGMIAATLFSGCSIKEAKASESSESKNPRTSTIIYQLNDKEIIIFDDNCHLISTEENTYKIFMDINNDERYSKSNNYIEVDSSKITYFVMPNSYEIAAKVANDTIGEDGTVIYYKDYFENIETNTRNR